MIAAFLFAMLFQPAAKPPADDTQWSCSTIVKGKRGASIDVSTQLTGDGDILSQTVGWSPPTAAKSALSRSDVEAPSLTLYYDDAEEGEIGEATSAMGHVMSLGAPAGTLDVMVMAVQIDGGQRWHAALEAVGPASPYRVGENILDFRSAWLDGGDSDVDFITDVESAKAMTLSVVNARDHPVSQARFDLTMKTDRDRLFARAWKKAEKMTLHPTRCDRVGGEEPALDDER